MYLNLISKYRTQLMGLAILWIVFFHTQVTVSLPILLFIKNIGFGGVDVFIFLSGLGVYYSLDKKTTIKQFYKRRILRILPYYIPVVIVVSLFYYYEGVYSLKGVVANVLMLSYWLDLKDRFDWYIPSILLLYLFAPLFYSFIAKNNKKIIVLFILLGIIVCGLIMNTSYAYLIGFFARVPLFIIGMYYAHYSEKNKSIKMGKKSQVFLFLYMILGFTFLFYLYGLVENWHRGEIILIWFLLMMIPCCLLTSYILSLFKNYHYPVLTFFGTYTLTIYIFHEKIMTFLVFNDWDFHLNITTLALTLVLAVSWKKLIDFILLKLQIDL